MELYTVYKILWKCAIIQSMERRDAVQICILLNKVQPPKQNSISFAVNFHADELSKPQKEAAKLSLQKLLAPEIFKNSQLPELCKENRREKKMLLFIGLLKNKSSDTGF